MRIRGVLSHATVGVHSFGHEVTKVSLRCETKQDEESHSSLCLRDDRLTFRRKSAVTAKVRVCEILSMPDQKTFVHPYRSADICPISSPNTEIGSRLRH